MAYTFKHGDRPIDGYTIQRAVGSGGFGEVYYAVSDGGREVALKYLRDNPQVELRGVSHCMNLKSPHLVSIFDVRKSASDEYFIVMEYISGPSLRDLLIAEPNGFAPEKAAFFARELAKGLAYLHDRGIVHRDLKPGNVFYDDGYVKIGDYGLSKFISISRHSAQTASVGTVHYMAPEIGSGNYSRGVDIYALGVILYEMLLGRVPFEGSSMGEVLMKHLMSQPQVDNLLDPFARVIRRALEKDPKDRYQTVDEMVSEILSGETVQKSLAGFSPESLSAAVVRGTADRAASPIPSPNPMFNWKPGAGMEETISRTPLPQAVERRMERISRKLDRKLSKLEGRPRKSKKQTSAGDAPQPQPRPKVAEIDDSGVARHGAKRMLLCAMLTVVAGFVSGIVFGNVHNNEEVGAAAGMLVVAMTAAVPLSRYVTRWLGPDAHPIWVQRLVSLFCSAPLIFVAAAPMLSHGKFDSAGLTAACALVVMAVLANWSKEIENGLVGELSFGTVFWSGLATFLISLPFSGLFDAEPDDGMLVGAVAAALASLNLQAGSWWLRGRITQFEAATAQRSAVAAPESVPTIRIERGAATSPLPSEDPVKVEALPRFVEPPVGRSGPRARPVVAPRVRSGLARMFWGFVGFLAMAGATVTFILAIVEPMSQHERAGVITGCIACSCLMIFALARTGPYRRIGFWANTLQPALTCLMLFAIGACITGLALLTHKVHAAPLIVGLVMASCFLVPLALSWAFSGGSGQSFVMYAELGADGGSAEDGERAKSMDATV